MFGELEPIPAAYRNRDARLDDGRAGHAGVIIPTLGVGMEQALLPDFDATVATFRAFKPPPDDDWDSPTRNVFTAPYITTMCRPAEAVRELEWALERDARFIVMIPARSPPRSACARPAIRCSTNSGSWQTIPGSPCAAG